jgi:cobalt-zinc-cadmium efflux system protein
VHHHSHDGHGHAETGSTARHRTNALLLALAANVLFLVVELVGGLVFGSLALLADAAHLVSDVVALGIALFAQVVAARPPTERHTYGFVRAEVLAAQANGVLLFAGAIVVVVEAVRRFGTTPDIHAGPVLVIGVIGLFVNAGSAVVLGRRAGRDLNLRAAMLHMAFDAAGSVAVIISAIGVLLWDATWLDSVASLAIASLVVISAWQLLRGTTRVLLEAAPAGTDVATVRDALAREPDVDAVHHVHVWSLASETPALSAHVVLSGENWTLHDAQERMEELKTMLADQFGITHATLEVECHACESADEHAPHA